MRKIESVSTSPFHSISFFNVFLIAIFLIIEAVIFSGCRSAVPLQPVKGFDSPGIKRVLVLPFKNFTRIYGENVSLRNPISGKVFITGSVAKDADNLLTSLLMNAVIKIKSYELIPPEQTEGLIVSNPKENHYDQDERHEIMEMGRQLGADAVLVGYLYRFKERVGSKYAVDSAASVAFDLNMINVGSGKIIWDGYFDETQKSLNENLFLLGVFLKRGGVWVTAEQMASTGLDDLIQKIPMPEH